MIRGTLAATCLPLALAALLMTAPAPLQNGPAHAQQATNAAATEEAEVTDTHDPNFKPEFTVAYLGNDTHIDTGEEIWIDQCRHCHGKSAYPGKAPKLKPKKYEPGFVYRRITNGFRKMPPWKDVYTDEERMTLVAYILSKRFSP